MAAITGAFQILGVYYGLLPVLAWNVVAVLVNVLSVCGYAYFVRRERASTQGNGYILVVRTLKLNPEAPP